MYTQGLMRNLTHFSLISLLAAGSIWAQATTFTAKMDGYQVIGGAPSAATADFKIFVYSTTAMRFDFTPRIPAGNELKYVVLSQCQTFCNGNQIYILCGLGSGNPRATCSQTGYVSTNGGELVASDLLPYGSSKDISALLDLMRHNLIYITAYFGPPSTGSYLWTPLRGQLAPTP